MEKITAYKTTKGEIFESQIDAEQQELNYDDFDFILTNFINNNMLLDQTIKGYVQYVITMKSDELIEILKRKPIK